MNIQLNAWSRLQFHDPETVLKKLRRVELEVVPHIEDQKVRTLRTHGLKAQREARDAAIFSYGIGTALGTKVFMARQEACDYDFVTCWKVDSELHFCPVQLKELPPAELHAKTSLYSLLDRLSRFSVSENTVLAVKLNREMRFEHPPRIPESIPFRQIWFFGGTSADQNEWFIYGDALREAAFIEFRYPT